MTVERYGKEVDETSAEIIDALDAAFKETGFTISDHDGLSINRNRHCVIKDEKTPTIHGGKIPREVFDAIRETNLHVSGVHTDIGGPDEARIWVSLP